VTGVRRVTLLICGEAMRGDDGVADIVLAALPASTRALADVRPVGQLMPDDLLDCEGPVIMVDAVDGPPPGEIVDLPLSALLAADSGVNPGSSHALPLPITLAVAKQLRGALPEGRFVGLAADSYEIGAGLSPAVRDAVPVCAASLDHWVRVLAHETRAG
jgi:hydrogenase maturation protease